MKPERIMTEQQPQPKFPFLIRFDNGARGRFEQCSGLDADDPATDFRHGNSPVFHPIKMPGLGRVGDVVLHKGIFADDDPFRDLRRRLEAGAKESHRVVIDLVNERNAILTTWTLENARPMTIVVMGEPVEGQAVVERIEIAFERIVRPDPETMRKG